MMTPILSYGKGIILALVALPLLPILVANSYLDMDSLSQLVTQFLS